LLYLKKAEISSLSQENDFDVDEWISQAKQLHADLERSRLTAREIVKQHENTVPLQSNVEDAAAKVNLVEKEIIFNQAVTNTLEEVQSIYRQLDSTLAFCQDGRITNVVENLEAIEHAINQDSYFKYTNVKGLLLENVSSLRQDLVSLLHSRWNQHFKLDHKEGTLVISSERNYRALLPCHVLTKNRTEDALEETISALAQLDELATANDQFQKDLFLVVMDSILLPDSNGYSHGIQVLEGSIRLEPEPSPASVRDVLGRVGTVFTFLHQSLPLAISSSLSDTFIPAISSKIISHWLLTAIPTELEGMGWFEATLNHVLDFTKLIGSLNWHGQEELVSWVNQAPRLWLTRRRVDSLDQVRKVLSASKGDSRQVERVEKRQIHASDEVLLDNSTLDDWDAGWDDQNHDDVDVSAWGLDDDKEDSKATKAKAGVDDDEDDGAGDAWGWAEDDEEDQSFEDTAPSKAATEAKPSRDQSHSGPREITLKECYTITDVPDSILHIIRQQVADSVAISQPA
jgi:centromere/kinetochore protein ZW10